METVERPSQNETGVAIPVGKGRRRASLVIKETEDLLHGLHADANRSDALMAELEALLASSQAASREAPSRCNSGAETLATTHFAAVQPLQAPVTDEGNDDLSPQDEVNDDLSPQGEVSLPPVRPVVSVRRRSSIVTFDGSSLFGGSGVTGAGERVSAVGYENALPAGRRPRSRASGRSWADGQPNIFQGSVRRRTGAEQGGAAPGVFSPIGAIRRSSTTDEQELVGRIPSQGWCVPSATCGAPGAASPCAAAPGQPAGLLWVSSTEGCMEELPDPEAAGWRNAIPMSSVKSPNGGGEQASRPASRARSGRFIKMLKGIFNTNGQLVRGAPQTQNGLTGSPGQPQSATGSGMGGSSSPNSNLHTTVVPAPQGDIEAQREASTLRPVTRDSLFTAHRNSSLIGGSGRPLHCSSFRLAVSAPVDSLSTDSSLASQTVGEHPHASHLAAEGKAAAGLSSRGTSRRSPACTLPQI